MLMEDADEAILKGGVSRQLDHLITSAFTSRHERSAHTKDQFLDHRFTTDATLVGIGAPIHIYLPDVAQALDTRFAVPENAGVANAIGAITGNVVVEEKITIKPVYSPGGISVFNAFSTVERVEFHKLADAVDWARTKVREMAAASASERGACEFEIAVTVHHDEVDISGMRENGVRKIVEEPDPASSKANTDEVAESDAPVEEVKMLLLKTVVAARAIGKINYNAL
ncbi:MAG: hypothetical protein ACYCYM_13955 [Saccharofermentanales bacterium]